MGIAGRLNRFVAFDFRNCEKPQEKGKETLALDLSTIRQNAASWTVSR